MSLPNPRGQADAASADDESIASEGPPNDSGLDAAPEFDNEWLGHFYHECGREVTLAYTTLNQMKNWSIVILGAIVAAVVSFGDAGPPSRSGEMSSFGVSIVVGAVLGYLFTLRFFIRAILCYNNLCRWNKLQKAIVELKVLPQSKKSDATEEERRRKLALILDLHYHQWLAPLPRSAQIASNLKLGFGLLLALPILLIVWGAIAFWDQFLVRGLVVFAAGGTAIELIEFMRSRFFNTPEVDAKRRDKPLIFPVPVSQGSYIVLWTINLWVSSITAFLPGLWEWIGRVAAGTAG